MAKFTTSKDGSQIFNQDYNEILLLTGNSKINIYKPGKGGGIYEATELMKVREVLAK